MNLGNGCVAGQSKAMEGFEKDSEEFRPRNNWFHSGSSQKSDVWTRKVDIFGDISWFLDVFETEKLIDKVLSIMADEMLKDDVWKQQQKLSFLSLSKKYKLWMYHHL